MFEAKVKTKKKREPRSIDFWARALKWSLKFDTFFDLGYTLPQQHHILFFPRQKFLKENIK